MVPHSLEKRLQQHQRQQQRGSRPATAALLQQLYSKAASRRRQAAQALQQQQGLGAADVELLEEAQQDPFRGLVGREAGGRGARAGARAFGMQVGGLLVLLSLLCLV